MKKYIIVLILFSITLTSYSQRRGNSFIGWVTVGLKGAVGNSLLLNSNVNSDQNVKMNYLSPGFNYGLKGGVGFNDKVGIYYEFMPGSFSTKYTIADSNQYDKNVKYKTMEHLFLVRLMSETGGYFEIGPKFSSAKSLTVDNSIAGNYNDINESIITSSYTSIVAGFGFSPYMGNRTSVSVGIRAAYAFDDFVNDSKNSHQIVNDGVYTPAYDSYAQTNPLTIQFVAEFTYDMAYFGKASCGKKRIIFFQ